MPLVLVDTCVVSELTRRQPDPRVTSWFDRAFTQSFLSSPVVLELEAGLAAASDPSRTEKLRAVFDRILRRFPPERRLVFDEVAASQAGKSIAAARREGRPLGVIDAQLIGIAAAVGCAVATRDRDFDGRGVSIINPWTDNL